MHLPILLLLLSSLWSGLSHAHGQTSDALCYRAVQYSLKNIYFADTDFSGPKPVRPCTSRLRTTSLYLSLQVYCTEESRAQAVREYRFGCLERANISLPAFEDVVSGYGPDEVRALRRIRPEEVTRKALECGEVALPSRVLWRRAFDTLNIAGFEHDIHITYGNAMYYFWAVVVAVGMLFRLSSLVTGIRKQGWQAIPDSEDEDSEDFYRKVKPGIRSLPGTYLKRHITVPATFGYRCSQNIGWCTLPPRIQSLTIAAFVVINIVLCSVNYFAFPGNLYWPEVPTQLWRYFSDRTGVIAFANFPLIWLFGMRNNLLMNILGWGFGTMNSFHRWVARVATIEAIAHSIGYTVLVFRDGGWSDFMLYWKISWWQYGELATIAMVLICIFSVYGLRRSYYELFLFLHIAISLAVLLGMWYHIIIFGTEYTPYIWPCVYIWLLDRALRTSRVLASNPRFWTPLKATTTYDAGSNILRLKIPYAQSLVKPVPGAYYYLTFLDGVRVWENHPFTLAYSTSCHDPSSNSDSGSGSDADADTSLIFLIRPYDGLTARLRKNALRAHQIHTSYTPRVLVEGPYGAPPPLHKFPHILFLAGGSGIATPLSYLAPLVQDAREGARTRCVHVVWAVREQAFLADVVGADLHGRGLLGLDGDGGVGDGVGVRVSGFVTGDVEVKDSVAETATTAAELQADSSANASIDAGEVCAGLGLGLALARTNPALSLHIGRPDISAIVANAADEAGGEGLAVVACGPGAMADEARKAVVAVLGLPLGRGVEYFEESFKW